MYISDSGGEGGTSAGAEVAAAAVRPCTGLSTHVQRCTAARKAWRMRQLRTHTHAHAQPARPPPPLKTWLHTLALAGGSHGCNHNTRWATRPPAARVRAAVLDELYNEMDDLEEELAYVEVGVLVCGREGKNHQRRWWVGQGGGPRGGVGPGQQMLLCFELFERAGC